MECFRCGVSDDKSVLKDAISSKGIVKICRRCSIEEGLPIIQKPNEYGQVRPKPPVQKKEFVSSGVLRERKELAEKQNENLRRILDRNAIESSRTSKKMENLTDNFHWTIMRARRALKMTQGQLAEKINEAPALIALAEKGFIADGKYDFAKKIESALKIKILKDDKFASFDEELKKIKSDFIHGAESGKINFDKELAKTLTTSDLREMNKSEDEDSEEEKKRKKSGKGFFARLFRSEEKSEEEKSEQSSDLRTP